MSTDVYNMMVVGMRREKCGGEAGRNVVVKQGEMWW
jgi:hypothetical protein